MQSSGLGVGNSDTTRKTIVFDLDSAPPLPSLPLSNLSMFKDFTSFLDTQRAGSPQPLSPCRYSYCGTDSSPAGEGALVHVRVEADPCIYDSGKLIVIAYSRNNDEPYCKENEWLDSEDPDDVALDELLEIYPDFHTLPFYDTATRITIKTIDGKLTTTITEDLDTIISYLPIPPSLSHIPIAQIRDLKLITMIDMDVDRVKWRGSTYAFKRTAESHEGTLRELAILHQLANSSNIIDLVAIVVNRDNQIRGFLTPFVGSGNLQSVFMAARQSLGLGDEGDAVAFDWPLKLSWARQITQGVIELHAISAYNGDLKPQNVLINSTGRALLIDFLPTGITQVFAAPEVLEAFNRGVPKLSAPADVYSLGLLLSAVAEEKWGEMRTPTWRGGTPEWYRDIVNRCLALAAEDRPSATEVLSLLLREGS